MHLHDNGLGGPQLHVKAEQIMHLHVNGLCVCVCVCVFFEGNVNGLGGPHILSPFTTRHEIDENIGLI